MRDRIAEAVAIWSTHGAADAYSTVLAAETVGIHAESNPIIRHALKIGPVATLLVMCCGAGVAAALWPVAAEAIDAPQRVAICVSAVGLLVALVNMVVVL